MTHADVQHWIDEYVEAWRSSGTHKLAKLFASDIRYSMSPWKPAVQGLPELEAFWEQGRSGPDEAFQLQSSIVAVESRIAVARIEVKYAHDAPSRWRDLWIMTFDERGLCILFEEWPFAPGQYDGHDY